MIQGYDDVKDISIKDWSDTNRLDVYYEFLIDD